MGRSWRRPRPMRAFAFHHVNAFEDGDGLVIDMIAYPDAAIIDQLYLARLRAGTPLTATGKLTRFRVTFGDAPVTRRTLAPMPLELPRINYEVLRRQALSLCLGHGHPSYRRLPRFHRQDRCRDRRGRNVVRAGLLSRRAGVRPRAVRRPPRMTACSCRSCSTSARTAPSCSCSMPQRSQELARARGPPRHPLPFPRQLLRRLLERDAGSSVWKGGID